MNNQSESEDKSNSNNSGDEEEMSYFEAFKQQMLRAWLPIPTLTKTITLFFIMSIIFIGIGIPMLILSNTIQEVRIQYDNSCPISTVTNCTLTVEVPASMEGPVFVYYELNNYFQNHRLYASSVSQKQLSGQSLSLTDISSDCSPITTNSQLYKTVSINGTPLIPDAPANPCGIIAYSIFNDTFQVKYPNASLVSISTNDIAWPSDLKKYQMGDQSKQWYNVTDPRFMNWMRIATLSNFRKLWGRINAGVPAGNYTLIIQNIYDVSPFGTTKYFVLSTSNFFGSKNQFLSIIYLVMGGMCFIVGVMFLIRKIKRKRKDG